MQSIIATLAPPLSPVAADLLDCALDGARSNFDRDGYLHAALITGNYSPAKPGAVIVLPGMSPETKPAITAFINQQRRQNDLCALVVECWKSVLPKSEFANAYQERITPPSQDPKRTECVMVMLYEGGRIVGITAEITRQDGGFPTLREWCLWHDTATNPRPLVGNLAAPVGIN